MYQDKSILFLYAETPVHPGASSGSGAIDLPIQREAFSDLPIIQASGIKGALREYFEDQAPSGWPGRTQSDRQPASPIIETFGPETTAAAEHAGAMTLGDAKVLLFPVRSLYGIFAYLTCPLVLKRFRRDLEMLGVPLTTWPLPLPEPAGNEVKVGVSPAIAVSNGSPQPRWTAVFGDYTFTAVPDPGAQAVAEFIRDHALPATSEYQPWKAFLPGRLAIVADDVFRDYTKTATEVIARNKLDDKKKTVAQGALWIEEHLPAETLLYSPVLAADPLTNPARRRKALQDARAVLRFLKSGCTVDGRTFCGVQGKRVHLGGDQTVGRGIVMTHFYP